MGKSSWISNHAPMNNWLAKVLHSEMLKKVFIDWWRGFFKTTYNYLLLELRKQFYPPKRNMSAKKGPFQMDISSSNNHQFSGDIRSFSGVCPFAWHWQDGYAIFLGQKPKKNTHSAELCPNHTKGRFYPILPWKEIRRTQWTWVYWVFPTPLGQTFGRVFWKPQSGSELFFSQGKKLKMMEPKLAFSLTTHQLVTKVRVNAVFS